MAQFIGLCLAKFQAPLPYRFIGEHDASLCHEFLDIAKTEREAEIQPDAVADDFRWEAVSFVIGNRLVCFHETILPDYPTSLAKLTIPLGEKAELSTTERGSTPSAFYPGGPLFGTSVDVCSKTLLCVMSLAARSRMMARRSCSSFCMLHWRYHTIKGFNGTAHCGKTYCS